MKIRPAALPLAKIRANLNTTSRSICALVGWVLCAARYVFLQRTFKPWEARVGALGGQYGRRSTPRQLRVHLSTPRQLRVEVRLAVLGNCSETERSASCALPHRAQSSVRVNAQLSSPTCSSTNRPIRGTSIGHPTPRKTRALESGLLENEPTAPAEQAHTTRGGSEKTDTENSCVRDVVGKG